MKSLTSGRHVDRLTAGPPSSVGSVSRLLSEHAGSWASPIELKSARYARSSGRTPIAMSHLRKSRHLFKAGSQIVKQGEPRGRAFILEHGWTFSSCTLRSGSRQILDVQIPGDVANLQGLLLPFAPHDVTAITEVEIFEVGSDLIGGDSTQNAEFAAFLFWLMASESAVTSIRLTDLGRRSALERIAHFILELSARLGLAGLGDEEGFPCPMTQYLIADALGLTPIHVNRIFRELRTSQLARHQRGWLSLLDKDKLVVLAQFDSAYLQHAC